MNRSSQTSHDVAVSAVTVPALRVPNPQAPNLRATRLLHRTVLGRAARTILIALAVGFAGAPTQSRAQSATITVGAVPADGVEVLRDGYGREITLRGFNVSGSAKLTESGFLPFRTTADAVVSAQAMRDQTGANLIRFLISWEGMAPAPGTVDTAYLARMASQIEAFTDRGFYVLMDYHQDLYSSHLFNAGSWYTGDGAPAWVIAAGSYPQENCGICLLWGQNILTNAAVRDAMHDFWHDRVITTSAGAVSLQSAFLVQATQMMSYLRQQLPASSFQHIIGVDPFNEPFDGGLDGASGTTWEQTYLLPFYQKFRAAMDAAGWADKLAVVEPLVFWNSYGTGGGGFSTIGSLGPRYVFNAHYYDGARMTIDPTWPGDGTYADPFKTIRDRATTLKTAALVSEFGASMGDSRAPWIVRSEYESLDHEGKGSDWWSAPGGRGHVLSSTEWHWDIYSGRHHELMNGNPAKLETAADAFNGEDYSAVLTDSSGTVVQQRFDQRLEDRIYPSAVAGDVLAFATEDLASSGFAGGSAGAAWLTVPASLPTIAALTSGRRYGVLVWRETAAAALAPTELHLPAGFSAAHTLVVSDLGTTMGLPTAGAVAIAAETGSTSAQKLLLTSSGAAVGAVHVALVVDGTGSTASPPQLAAATSELIAWQSRLLP
jgi:hypothetical protein